MDVETLLARLQKVRYFEGYSDAAIAKATRAIRKRHAAGTAGPQKLDFERHPGLALVTTDIDLELSDRDELKRVLRQLAAASFGMFVPRAIQIRLDDDEQRYRLQFTLGGVKHVLTLEDSSWIPGEFFERLEKVTRKSCSGLAFQAVDYPPAGQSAFLLWCTPRAFKAIIQAGLIPSRTEPAGATAAQASLTKPVASPPAPTADAMPELAPPADPARAERMGLFKKGQWKIPWLSKRTFRAWQDFDASTAAPVGPELMKQILWRFDLLCTQHCGVSGIGDAAEHAQQIITLVDRYLFGAWRVGYVSEGVELTEATARKELLWSSELQKGCAAAAWLGDASLYRFLEYPRHEIYDEHIQDEVAYYRLLSDVVLRRSEWDWAEQAGIIAKGIHDRLPKLLRCLKALKDDDPATFKKAIFKFATKPKVSFPPTYSYVVDPDVTLLVALARDRNWPVEDFPERLQDKILSPHSTINRTA